MADTARQLLKLSDVLCSWIGETRQPEVYANTSAAIEGLRAAIQDDFDFDIPEPARKMKGSLEENKLVRQVPYRKTQKGKSKMNLTNSRDTNQLV